MGTSFHLATWLFASLILKTTLAQISYRLPNNVVPNHYDLAIATNLATFNFTGKVEINVRIVQATDQIVLHSKDLNISSITVLNSTSHNIFQRYETVVATDFLRLWLNSSQPVNTNLRINIEFNGFLGTGNVGFYRASYVDHNNVVRHLALTHLEATNARRAFPCFDQPNFKATFQIHLMRHRSLITASNTLIASSTAYGENVLDTYEITPNMSTYLIAFMVSDYSAVSTSENLVRYVTYGRRELILRGDGGYSLSVATRAIAGMENFTGYDYVLNTLDQVSVPNNYYKIGAMENWGMVTYRERLLMYNSERNTAAEKQSIATIISHELAHQWFGNLVTPQWWRYIWLNEGFATYFEMYITAQIEQSWDLLTQFATSIIQVAMDDDALETTRPMTRNAESPEEIEAQYDTIVYEKAGSIIRMAMHFLGNTTFRQGITSYINNYAFRNAEPLNLYAQLDAVSPTTINVTHIMTYWETQAGYPVITVNRSGNVAQITQERFFLHRLTGADQTIWPIPLTWLTATNVNNVVTWFTSRSHSLQLASNINQTTWVIFNANQTGFYRVNYDEANWRLIRDYLWTGDFAAIPVINRAQLLDDSFNLVRSGRLDLNIALDIGSYIRNETEYVPIRTFTKALGHIDRLFTGINIVHNLVRGYGIEALHSYFNRTGFIDQNDDHLTKMTKVQVLTWLCNLEHNQCRNTTRHMFLTWLDENNLIQPDSQSFVFCNGIRAATVEQWDIAFSRYFTINEDPERTRLAQGLGCTQNSTTLARLLDQVLLVNSVFSQSDKLAVITSVYTNNDVAGVTTILNWLTQNFTVINERIGNMANIIKGVSDRITNEAQRTLFNNFIAQHRNSFTTALNTTVTEASARITSNILWINSTSTKVLEYFENSAFSIYCHILLILSCILVSFMYK